MAQKNYLILLCSLFLVIACKNEQKLTFSETALTSENNNIVEVHVPRAVGNDMASKNINSEIEKTVSAALQIGNPDNKSPMTVAESITAFNKEFERFKTDFPETPQIWEAQIDGEVMFQSSEIITIAITSYINTGGAHGLLNISFLNFDAESGQTVANDKLVSNLESFKNIAKPYFEKAISEKEVVFESESFQLPANIGYSENGIVLLYNTYEIAPYSTGIIEFAIPFDDVEPYLVFNSL